MQTLYRKYRPSTFADVVGQDEIVGVLENSIKTESVSHAYLFSGTRGTGKTSIARIFAKELGTSDQDIYELDAASHTGVDNIRDLRSGVATIPFDSKYKVYIIDEAHMLSTSAANALLKTLEEPPAHAIFILATTEKHKILDTIKSRCVIFDFNSPSAQDLEPFIASVVEKEEATITEDAAALIAKQGEGSYRDTLSVLQKVLSSGIKKIDEQLVGSLYSSSDKELVQAFLQAYVGEPQKLLELLQDNSLKERAKQFIDQAIVAAQESLRLKHGAITEGVNIEALNTLHLKNLIVLRQEMESLAQPAVLLELFIYEQLEK